MAELRLRMLLGEHDLEGRLLACLDGYSELANIDGLIGGVSIMFERYKKITAFGLMIGAVLLSSFATEPYVGNVQARQIKDTKDVEVTYDLIAPDGGLFDVSVQFVAPNATPDPKSLSGDVGASVEPGCNRRLVWDAGTDWPDNLNSNFVCTVTAVEQLPAPFMGMVRIPGGTNAGNDPYGGQYSFTVETFYMDRTEVTYAQWQYVYNWAIKHGYYFDNPGSGKAANHPVHTISWSDAAKWCNARSEMESRKPVYLLSNGGVFRTGRTYYECNLDSGGYRLPTSIEWRYAACGGLIGHRFPWGDTISFANANYWGGGGRSYMLETPYEVYYDHQLKNEAHTRFDDGVYPYTAPVGSFAPNGYGLYDMAGNVYEYCSGTTGFRGVSVFHGGSWADSGVRCCINSGSQSYGSEGSYGFRCVRR